MRIKLKVRENQKVSRKRLFSDKVKESLLMSLICSLTVVVAYGMLFEHRMPFPWAVALTTLYFVAVFPFSKF